MLNVLLVVLTSLTLPAAAQIRVGGAINLFGRYGYLSISMKVVPRNETDQSWVFREPIVDVFKNVPKWETNHPTVTADWIGTLSQNSMWKSPCIRGLEATLADKLKQTVSYMYSEVLDCRLSRDVVPVERQVPAVRLSWCPCEVDGFTLFNFDLDLPPGQPWL
ncbi:hypothetical protein J6590_081760 [Homalodisca vitripennis]|nr:hypothetical protein J6590_081760 [Homalodisca vitripennis]